MTATTPLSALQAALAAEDAAIFGYGAAGAHLTGSSLAAAEQDWTGHHEARDALAAMISRRGATPAAAQAFYQLPFRVHDAASAKALAARLEEGVTSAYLGLVGVSDQGLRRFGALAMQAAARRAAFWRGSTQAFPGLDLLARSTVSGRGRQPTGSRTPEEPHRVASSQPGSGPLLGLMGLPGLVRSDLAMNMRRRACWQPARCSIVPAIAGTMLHRAGPACDARDRWGACVRVCR